jgi:hypothetical protein
VSLIRLSSWLIYQIAFPDGCVSCSRFTLGTFITPFKSCWAAWASNLITLGMYPRIVTKAIVFSP